MKTSGSAQLTGHLQAGLFVTKVPQALSPVMKWRDLVIVPARVGDHEDNSEYEGISPLAP